MVGVALLGAAGCSGTEPGTASRDDGGSAAVATPPPPPPAACLLDVDTMAGSTGLTWTPDAATASDTRCVYDPAPAARPSTTRNTATGAPTTTPAEAAGTDGEFVAVDVAPATDQPPAAQLDVLAQVCERGSRSPAGSGFVCRFGGGSVYAGLVRDGDVITLAASAVPAGTTAAALAVAFGEQVAALG